MLFDNWTEINNVDNMAWFTPENHPDERYYIFGNDASVDELAAKYNVEVLARIPLIAAIGDHNDSGEPIAANPESLTASAFSYLAHQVIDAVDRRNASLPPTLKVDMSRK